MAKHLVRQRFIYKIHSSRLRNGGWDIQLPLQEARANDEVVAMADSQVFRWIDSMNGVVDADEKAEDIRMHIKRIKREPNSPQNKRTVRKLYNELDAIQFKPDYMCLIIDKKKDYYRACKGFSINGVRYKRLLGTNGGIKNSTIVFVSERLHDELERRIENGRNKEIPLVTAKLEAYRALTCSASIPVSTPRGILVVPDVETDFKENIVYLTDEFDGEPVMEDRYNYDVHLDASDGCGLMLPSLAQRWSDELELGYMMSGCNTRASYEKGMVYTFDFIDFANKIAGTNIVKDAWGNDVDIRNIELVLTTSMLKLWDSYESCEDYLSKSAENGYTFGITKTCPEELESERNLNYQFIQSYDLDDDDIEELIAPTITEFKEVLGGDPMKTILFLRGDGLSEKNASRFPNDFVKAVMVDQKMMNDPYIRGTVYRLIKNRINQAKVGVIKVHGNFSIASGDPYLLCESIFGLEPKGLLKAGEIYNKYWSDIGPEKLACFRAPMTCHNNIRSVRPVCSDEASYWYQYMKTCTIFNGWDTAMAALNGMDFDGDLVMLTDNPVLVRKHKALPALVCAQRKAEKTIPDEDAYVESNIASFGNDIGQTTNWITSMFEVQAGFGSESNERRVLDYRIRCGQQYQQNAIDKAKGIISKPMPKTWHDRHAVNTMEDEELKSFYRRIVADKKPYFMKYIYPALMKQCNTYVKNTNRNALREFQMTVPELKEIPESELTERQKEFLQYYEYRMPVGTNDCVMNKICRRFEEEFDGSLRKLKQEVPFDYTIMRGDTDYSSYTYQQIKKLYDNYRKQTQSYSVFVSYERIDPIEASANLSVMDDEFRKQCSAICPDEQELASIILDICYKKESTKKFAWEMCCDEILRQLLEKNDQVVSFPIQDDDGELEYCGKRYRVVSVKLEDNE